MRVLMLMAASAALACDGATDVRVTPSPALLATFDGDPMALVDLATGKVEARPFTGFGNFGEEHRALSERDSLLVLSGGGQLVGFDLKTLAARWRESLGSDSRVRFADHILYANYALAVTPEEQRILVADTYHGGVIGVAVLSAATRDLLGFIDSMRVRAMFRILPGQVAAGGGVLAFGTRAEPSSGLEVGRREGKMFLLSGQPLAIQDSISFLSTADSAAGGVLAITVDAEARYLYYVTFARRLHKFDLANRTHVASLSLPSVGPVSTSSIDGSVFVIDGSWDFDTPGSGVLHVVDSDLRAYSTIDLSAAGMDGVPPLLNCVVPSRDGRFVYVGAGSAARGPTYGVQRGSVVVVDVRERTVSRVIRLGTWGVRSILSLK